MDVTSSNAYPSTTHPTDMSLKKPSRRLVLRILGAKALRTRLVRSAGGSTTLQPWDNALQRLTLNTANLNIAEPEQPVSEWLVVNSALVDGIPLCDWHSRNHTKNISFRGTGTKS
ncbi:hypothetical protein CRG98_001443 [Punica granatum]|uniref:Uncharacterized protein n=1 Tax=Punica granatum TaxID=22663 RepID=A0A2I0LBS2_PUNGR|nr:hypothetical protein CRG98_001443 [Punica granatum]